jgi:lysophospholipase L1-like esterase
MNAPTQAVVIVALLAWAVFPASGGLAHLKAMLRDDAPSVRDYDRIERGYYERLIDNDRRPEGPDRAAAVPFDAGVLAESVGDVREYVLKPNLVASHKGATWTTNARGMRDRDYPDAKASGTFRIALVGDSIAAGWGVDDGLGFEAVLERIWDERAGEGQISGARTCCRVEILNFAVPGHAPGQRWEHVSRVGWPTSPDLILFEGTLADLGWDERRLRALIPRGLGLDAPVYCDTLAEVGIASTTDSLKARLRPLRETLLLGVYRRVVADCRERGVPVVWVLLPRVGKPVDARDRATMTRLAKAAGFDRTLDLADAFDGRPASSLAIAPDDFHPNAAGHALLARRIDEALVEFLSPSAQSGRPLQ